MSQLVVVCNPDQAVAMVCDGVCYSYETGSIVGHVSKVIACTHRNMLIGATGMGGFGDRFFDAVEEANASFDDVIDNFASLARVVHRWMGVTSHRDVTVDERDASIAIAGWSEKRQAYEAYRVVSFDKPSVNGSSLEAPAEPWTPMPITGVWASFLPSSEILERFGLGDGRPQGNDLVSIGVRLVCAARASSGVGEAKDGSPRRYNAGGFVQVSTLQRDTVTSYIAHRWPDDIVGRPIDPALGEAMPAWLTA